MKQALHNLLTLVPPFVLFLTGVIAVLAFALIELNGLLQLAIQLPE